MRGVAGRGRRAGLLGVALLVLAVADARLRALRLIAQAPRSTQELASLIAISEAGLSKHLGILSEAGLVESRRAGYYVLYTLSDELRRFLRS